MNHMIHSFKVNYPYRNSPVMYVEFDGHKYTKSWAEDGILLVYVIDLTEYASALAEVTLINRELMARINPTE